MRIRDYTEPMSAVERHERDRERMRERLETLSHNLAMAGALCAAWYQGNRYALQIHVLGALRVVDGFNWSPGCGREVPR